MSEQREHAPEPWALYGENHHRIVDSVGKLIVNTGGWDHPHKPDDGTADARRIIACVNACAGLSTEDLEGVARERPDLRWCALSDVAMRRAFK